MVKKLFAWLIAMSIYSCCVAEGATPPSYGRFTVVDKGSYQEVEGGRFGSDNMPKNPPHQATAKHAIFVNYSTKELLYYRLTDGGYESVIGYVVMTPFPHTLPKDVVRGRVTRIVEKPTWCPKEGGTVRQAHPNLPKGCLPYGHPDNAMGDWRFDIRWDARGWELNKLHGVSVYAEGAFWTEKTHGCIRLMNEAISHLITLLGPHAVTEGIEIVVFRDSIVSLDYKKLIHLGE